MEEEMMKEIYSIQEQQCYAEVYDIIMFLDENLRKKIPRKWISFLEQTKLKGYITSINPYVPLQMQKIQKNTELIISYMYIKYLSDENEKKFFRQKEEEEKLKKYEKFEENIFKNNKKSANNVVALNQEQSLIVKKKSIWEKFTNLFFKLFK